MTYPPPGQPGQPGDPGQPPQEGVPGSPPPASYPNLPPPGAQPGYGTAPQPGYGTPPQPGYAAPPPPGYPAPPPGAMPYGEPPKKRRRWPWIVLGVVVVLIAAVVIIGLVFGREGSKDPKQAVDKFWTALVAHDTKKAEKYVCNGKDLTGKNDTEFKQLVDALTGYSVGPEAGSGSSRTYPVTVKVTVSGVDQQLVITTTVKKQTGKWYVCDLST